MPSINSVSFSISSALFLSNSIHSLELLFPMLRKRFKLSRVIITYFPDIEDSSHLLICRCRKIFIFSMEITTRNSRLQKSLKNITQPLGIYLEWCGCLHSFASLFNKWKILRKTFPIFCRRLMMRLLDKNTVGLWETGLN